MSSTSQLTSIVTNGQQNFMASNIIYIKRNDPQARCGYLSKPCDKLRAMARSGIFTDTAKSVATEQRLQCELERHRKVEKMVEQLPIDQYANLLNEQYEHAAKQEHLAGEQLPLSELLARLKLDGEELDVLAEVLDVNYD